MRTLSNALRPANGNGLLHHHRIALARGVQLENLGRRDLHYTSVARTAWKELTRKVAYRGQVFFAAVRDVVVADDGAEIPDRATCGAAADGVAPALLEGAGRRRRGREGQAEGRDGYGDELHLVWSLRSCRVEDEG